MHNFVDVSNHQRGISLSAIDSAAFIFKATEGRGWRDRELAGFVRQARALGKPIGFYHFVSQGNSAEDEALNFLAYTAEAGRTDEDLLVLDWEPTGRDPAPDHTRWAQAWLDCVTNRARNPLWIYMNLSTARSPRWGGSIRGRVPLWLAHYPGNNRADGYKPAGAMGVPHGWNVAAWQFTDGGKLPGWSGNLDLNQLYQPWWTTKAEDSMTTIPAIKENDQPVELRNSHGEILRSSSGRPRRGCICMAMTLPRVEEEMIRRGLIKRTIDVFQGGYNLGVVDSAGTHDMGGVIDVMQGISREEREVWAAFGVMMAPRTAQWGWHKAPHGHGVWHGCVHRTAVTAEQIRSMMAGFNGLQSNVFTDWVKPTRTWQDAYRALVSIAATALVSNPTASPNPTNEEDTVPTVTQSTATFQHPGGGWSRVFPKGPGESSMLTIPRSATFTASAQVNGPEDTELEVRFVAMLDGAWWRGAPAPRTKGRVTIAQTGRVPGALEVDVWSSRPCEVTVQQQAIWWPSVGW